MHVRTYKLKIVNSNFKVTAELKIMVLSFTNPYEVQFGRTNLLYISNGEANGLLYCK